jgi:hypothetical protein
MTAAKDEAQKATTPEAKKAVWKAARENINKNVLTDEQRAKLEQMKAKRQPKVSATKPA